MSYYLIAMIMVGIFCVILQLYDSWSTIKILKGPDGEFGTRDDGREMFALMKSLMDKIGIVPAIILKSILSTLFYVCAGYLAWAGSIPVNYILVGFIIAMISHLRVFIKYNFKHDGIGKS